MSETYRVHDGRDGRTRIIEFEGELLGNVSSRHKMGPRWTEQRLYKTSTGTYIAEKVGRSVVVHAPDCADILGVLPRFQEVYPGADPSDGNWWICERCGDDAVRDITRLLVETDRHWTAISPKPDEIVDSLYRRRNGAKSMPRAAIDLLDEASAKDEAIAKAFQSEFVR